MNHDMLIVFAVLAVTIGLFTTDWLRLDVVAMLSVLALMLFGVLDVEEGLAGFADPLVLIIAGLFVVGTGLLRTGVAEWLGVWLARAGGESPVRLLTAIMVVVALLSAFMSSTGTVAILLPVVVALAARARLSPSMLLMPMAFASLLGGMLTLIGTPPNIVVSEQLRSQGQEPFGFFAFTPVGVVMLVLGVGFVVVLGRRLLPARIPAEHPGKGKEAVSVEELAASHGLPGNLFRLRVRPDSELVGKSLVGVQVRARFRVSILEMSEPEEGDETATEAAGAGCKFDPAEMVLAYGAPEDVHRMAQEMGLEVVLDEDDAKPLGVSSGFAEVLLTPRSRLVGQTLLEARFRTLYDLTVLSVLRMGKPLMMAAANTPLRFGDALLVHGTWKRIRALRGFQRDFVVVAEPPRPSDAAGMSRKAFVALGIMVLMLVFMTGGWLPTVVVVLVAAMAMIVTGCLSATDAYGSMSWQSLVLIAAMLPMGTALQKTGGIALVVGGLTSSLGELGPIAMMGGLFLMTSLFSQFISNTATTVLVAPIAFQTATVMHVSPRTFLMTVAIAASTAFATPIASPVNTLVLTPGGYRFTDYTRVGAGIQLLILIATLLVVPWFFPLHG